MHVPTYPQGIWPKKISIPPTYPIHQTHFIQVATCLCEYTEEVSNKNSNNRIQQEAHSSLECSDIRKDRPGKTINKQQVISHYIVNENNNNIASSGKFFPSGQGGGWLGCSAHNAPPAPGRSISMHLVSRLLASCNNSHLVFLNISRMMMSRPRQALRLEVLLRSSGERTPPTRLR